MLYFDWTYSLILIAMVISMVVQARMQSTFSRYSRVANGRGLTGREAARILLDRQGLYQVQVVPDSRHMPSLQTRLTQFF